MSSLTDQEKILAAFLSALSQQDEPLPEGLQKQLHAIGQSLQTRIVELPTVAASLPRLNEAYQAALASNPDDESKATLASANQDGGTELQEEARKIFTDSDPVQVAQKKISPETGQVASNPLKRIFGLG